MDTCAMDTRWAVCAMDRDGPCAMDRACHGLPRSAGVDLCSALDETSCQLDGLRRVGLRQRRGFVLRRALESKQLRQLARRLAPFRAGSAQKVDGFGVLTACAEPEQDSSQRVTGVDTSGDRAAGRHVPAAGLGALLGGLEPCGRL